MPLILGKTYLATKKKVVVLNVQYITKMMYLISELKSYKMKTPLEKLVTGLN